MPRSVALDVPSGGVVGGPAPASHRRGRRRSRGDEPCGHAVAEPASRGAPRPARRPRSGGVGATQVGPGRRDRAPGLGRRAGRSGGPAGGAGGRRAGSSGGPGCWRWRARPGPGRPPRRRRVTGALGDPDRPRRDRRAAMRRSPPDADQRVGLELARRRRRPPGPRPRPCRSRPRSRADRGGSGRPRRVHLRPHRQASGGRAPVPGSVRSRARGSRREVPVVAELHQRAGPAAGRPGHRSTAAAPSATSTPPTSSGSTATQCPGRRWPG